MSYSGLHCSPAVKVVKKLHHIHSHSGYLQAVCKVNVASVGEKAGIVLKGIQSTNRHYGQ